MAAELLADGLDLAGGDTLDIHLHQGRHQCLLAALVTAEELGAETALPVLRHAQFEGAHAGDQLARIVAAAVAESAGAAFTLAGPEGLVHLGLEELLHGQLHQRAQQLVVPAQQGLEFTHGSGRAFAGHGLHGDRVALFALVPPMTHSLFAELSGHYLPFRVSVPSAPSFPSGHSSSSSNPAGAPALRAGAPAGNRFPGDNWQLCRSLGDAMTLFPRFCGPSGLVSADGE